MHVEQLWRYPVKSLAGEPLTQATLTDDGVEGDRVVHVRGVEADLFAYLGPERFDVLNLLVATDGAAEASGHDVRRLRPNLLIGGVDAAAEAGWPGNALAIGDALIGVHSVRQRCVVTSIDPDTGAQNLDVFRRIRSEFGNLLALNCWVIRPGTIAVGDDVQLVATSSRPAHLGGWILGAPYTTVAP